jgi:hypothetical protein
MKLIITIDTEEDNWACYSTKNNPVKNIERIVYLQKIFDQYGITPTYLVTYPVANNPRSVGILKGILEEGKCEIGAHCHPWNTPPFEEEINDYNSMLCNLPEGLQYRKISCLHEIIYKNFNIAPVSFRAGRWGFGSHTAKALYSLGYKVDSSLTPTVDWSVYNGPDFSDFDPEPFFFNAENSGRKNFTGIMLEVPATIGFLQSNFLLSRRLLKTTSRRWASKIHLGGILQRAGLLNQIWLSPEHAKSEQMIKLARRMAANEYSCLNMTFHSTSLMAGLSPFTGSEREALAFLNAIKKFLDFSFSAPLESITLSAFEKDFKLKQSSTGGHQKAIQFLV